MWSSGFLCAAAVELTHMHVIAAVRTAIRARVYVCISRPNGVFCPYIYIYGESVSRHQRRSNAKHANAFMVCNADLLLIILTICHWAFVPFRGDKVEWVIIIETLVVGWWPPNERIRNEQANISQYKICRLPSSIAFAHRIHFYRIECDNHYRDGVNLLRL